MNISPWLIYLWGIADNARAMFGIFTGVAAFVGVIGFIITTVESDDIEGPLLTRLQRIFGRLLIAAVVAACLATFIPSSKTIAVMVIAPALVNSKPVQEDIPELYSIAIDALKSSLKDKVSK